MPLALAGGTGFEPIVSGRAVPGCFLKHRPYRRTFAAVIFPCVWDFVLFQDAEIFPVWSGDPEASPFPSHPGLPSGVWYHIRHPGPSEVHPLWGLSMLTSVFLLSQAHSGYDSCRHCNQTNNRLSCQVSGCVNF